MSEVCDHQLGSGEAVRLHELLHMVKRSLLHLRPLEFHETVIQHYMMDVAEGLRPPGWITPVA